VLSKYLQAYFNMFMWNIFTLPLILIL
jgi:hypothetical protein